MAKITAAETALDAGIYRIYGLAGTQIAIAEGMYDMPRKPRL